MLKTNTVPVTFEKIHKINFRSKPKKVKKMTIIQLSIRYFKVRIRKLVMIVLMIAVTITLFLSVNLYVTQYRAQFLYNLEDGKLNLRLELHKVLFDFLFYPCKQYLSILDS